MQSLKLSNETVTQRICILMLTCFRVDFNWIIPVPNSIGHQPTESLHGKLASFENCSTKCSRFDYEWDWLGIEFLRNAHNWMSSSGKYLGTSLITVINCSGSIRWLCGICPMFALYVDFSPSVYAALDSCWPLALSHITIARRALDQRNHGNPFPV